MKPAMTPQQAKFSDPSQSAFALYKELAVGKESYLFLAYYELAILLGSNLPGLLGFGARAVLYPPLFKKCGKKAKFGRGVHIRNPKRTTLGKNFLIDDYAVLDVRGGEEEASITISDHVSIGRFTTLVAKQGDIVLNSGVNIGSYCRIATQSRVEIGESTLIAAYAYIGPGNHQHGDGGEPLISREMEVKGGVKIGAHAWIGARATILDGVSIGEGAIIGAHSVVRSNVPPFSVAVGTPARIVGKFKSKAPESMEIYK